MGKKGGEQRRKGEGRVEEELGGEGMGRKKVRKTRAVFFLYYLQLQLHGRNEHPGVPEPVGAEASKQISGCM